MRVRSPRERLRLALLRVGGGAVGFAVVAVLVLTVGHGAGSAAAQPAGVAAVHAEDPVVARVADLVRDHHCWTGQAPVEQAGSVPGHAVVLLPDEDAPRLTASAVGFGIWLDHDPGRLFAFCP